MNIQEIILAAAIILSALMSGFFFAYTFSVNSGLHKLQDKAYLSAMQNINRAVLNPVFYICFLGTLILLICASIMYFDARSPKFYLIFSACISYTVGVFFITGTRNVPLNNRLDTVDIANASETSLKNIRRDYERPWNNWNNIRTLTSFIAFACLIISVIFFN